MTQAIDSLNAIAGEYDAIVFDQWGVLHQGTSAYPGALEAISTLAAGRAKLGVLSNSGKRASLNAERVGAMGFDVAAFDSVMTSGEALWRDIAAGRIAARNFHPVTGAAGDAEVWAEGLSIAFCDDANAEAILLMGLPDGSTLDDRTACLKEWRIRELTVYCSNPDRQSPRAGGLVLSPGALAYAYRDLGGEVVFYGKPHPAIFRAVEADLVCDRTLMVGDSLEHDIAGAQAAGWDSLLIEGGLYAEAFASGDGEATLAGLVQKHGTQPPTFRMKEIRA